MESPVTTTIMEPGIVISDESFSPISEHQVHQDAASVPSKDSQRTLATAFSLSSSGSSAPSSPPSFTRRRRTHQQQDGRGSPMLSQRHDAPLFALKERRPPSVSTVTNLSESVSYISSDDGEYDDHELPSYGELTVPMNSSISTDDFHGDEATRFDLEMGVVTSGSSDSGPRVRPLSPQGHQQPTTRTRLPSSSGRQRFHTTSSFSPPSVTTSSLSSSSFRSRRGRAGTMDSTYSRHTGSMSDRRVAKGFQQPQSSLRASLDAGMAAVRTWIRSRGSGPSLESNCPSKVVDLRPRSRSVTWQTSPQSGNISTVSLASQNTTNSEELDDLLQLDDLSTYTNNSARTDDSHLNSNVHNRPASAPTILPYGHISRQPRTSSFQHFFSHPDTIIEELEEGGDGHMGHMSPELRSRKRSQSEPDGRRIPDFFLGPPPTTRYHNNNGSSARYHASTSAATTRPRRRHLRRPKQYHGTPPPAPHRASHQPPSQSRRNSQPLPFSRRIPGRPRVENEIGASLSTSAAAALSDNPNSQSPPHTVLLHEFSDAGASIATTTMPPESAIELTVTPANAVDSVGSSSASPNATIPQSSSFRNTVDSRDDGTHVSMSGSHAESSSSELPRTPTRTAPHVPREGSVRSNNTQVTDSERHARIRWIRINRRFQFVITVVALIFSLLLFAILICWVVLTSAYVLSFDKSCDVPLKRYFWLVTLQLVLDVFRSDIMRFVFHWDANSNQRIPIRVVAYNITYLIYALLVLRLGVRSVFMDRTTCDNTAPELFNASTAFVSLSIAAWTTILCGYLLPFCVVAALLTCNGYNPTSHNRADDQALNRDRNVMGSPGAGQAVFPAAYATTGAPPGTVNRLSVVRLENVPETSRECCICMEEFAEHDVLVETSCKHIFHKQCCREWLRQARTCPVCRSDIPGSLQAPSQMEPDSSSRIPIGPTGRPVVGLLRILRRTTGAIGRNMSTTSSPTRVGRNPSNGERVTSN